MKCVKIETHFEEFVWNMTYFCRRSLVGHRYDAARYDAARYDVARYDVARLTL